MVADHSCIWYIRNLHFFPQLDEASMMQMASQSKMITAKRGDRITVRSTAAGYAYLVKEGHLRVVRNGPDGRTIATDILEPGDVIGITPILTEDADADSAEALEDVLFCRLPASMLREVLEENSKLALHYSKLISLRRRTLETRLVDIAFCTVKVRLARLFLDLSNRFGEKTPQGILLRLKLTHQELGDMIGANREAANRGVSSLLDAGIVRFVGKRLEIINLEGLKAAAELNFDWRGLLSEDGA